MSVRRAQDESAFEHWKLSLKVLGTRALFPDECIAVATKAPLKHVARVGNRAVNTFAPRQK